MNPRTILVWAESIILVYFFIVNGFYLVLLGSAAFELVRTLRLSALETRWRVLGSPVAPRISVLAPAYNEEATIGDSVRSLLSLQYPNLEIVVVNDGSPDGTLARLIERFGLQPVHPVFRRRIDTAAVRGLYRSAEYASLVVVDKENGGKADALNAAINVASGELVCAIDADTLIEPDALQRMIRPFLTQRDVVAAGGTIRVANGSRVEHGIVVDAVAPRRPLPGYQSIEYLRAFLFGRVGWNRLGGNLVISGAFGLFRREAVADVGGYASDSIGEDMELVMRLRRRAYERKEPGRVIFVPDPVAWTEVPENLRTLGRQRDRWQRGLADSLWRHRGMLFRPRYRALAFIAFPYFLFVELAAPVIELLGLIGLAVSLSIGAVDLAFAGLFFLVAYGLGTALSVLTLLLDELGYHRFTTMRDRLRMLFWALTENFGYRQITVWWRVRGIIGWMRGRSEWGAMERRGFAEAPSADG